MTTERKLKLSGDMIVLDTSDDRFMVMRNCCTAGNCNYCTLKSKYGHPLRIIHIEDVTLYQAQQIAERWKQYDPEVVQCEP